jgi:oxysterol-binding protein-related protein 9/10/11
MNSYKADEHTVIATPLHPTDDNPTLSSEDADAQAAAIDVPDDTGDGGRLRMIVQLVKRSFGVKDLAAM